MILAERLCVFKNRMNHPWISHDWVRLCFRIVIHAIDRDSYLYKWLQFEVAKQVLDETPQLVAVSESVVGNMASNQCIEYPH